MIFKKAAVIISGILLSFIVLEAGLRVGAWTILTLQRYENVEAIKKKGAFRIMCIGESTTQNQYPRFLEEILNQNDIGIKFSVIDCGRRAVDTNFLLKELSEVNLDKYKPDMVIAMMGVNDLRGITPYEVITGTITKPVFKTMKIYKLFTLIRMHVSATLNKNATYDSPKDREESQIFNSENADNPNIEKNKKDWDNLRLAHSYQSSGRYNKAEGCFKKEIRMNPENWTTYFELGCLYRDNMKSSDSEKYFKKAMGLNPENEEICIQLGIYYKSSGNSGEAEKYFRKAIKLNPKNTWGYVNLAYLFRDINKIGEGVNVMKEAIKKNPNNHFLYATIAILNTDAGNFEIGEEYNKTYKKLTRAKCNPVTYANYRKLKSILDARRIHLACVQYPMHDIMEIRDVFYGQAEEIIFVDNEKIFKDAVKKNGYKKYFCDIFAGDFGHCTDEGNKLLAQNIADVILNEYFSKKNVVQN